MTILGLSKRFFFVANFFNHAMAEGIYNLLKLTRTGLAKFNQKKCITIFTNVFNFRLIILGELRI
jgi:hypothetical protein